MKNPLHLVSASLRWLANEIDLAFGLFKYDKPLPQVEIVTTKDLSEQELKALLTTSPIAVSPNKFAFRLRSGHQAMLDTENEMITVGGKRISMYILNAIINANPYRAFSFVPSSENDKQIEIIGYPAYKMMPN